MKFLFAFEKFLVRRFGFSLVSWLLSRQTRLPPVPTLLLTTIGRKSGRSHEMPVFYFRDGASYFVIASKGGAPRHPAWFLNLEANPRASIHAGRRKIAVRARLATEAERTRCWAVAAKAYPPYDAYQTRAGVRRIPVVILDPVSAGNP